MNRTVFHIPSCWKRGLTLGEMLVVLAVFMMLAVMFFFSSNLAITKTKLARVSKEQKDLARELVVYEGTYAGEYPTDTQGLSAVVGAPISMLKRVPPDPFAGSASQAQEYGYYSDLSQNYRWILVSVGPDGSADVDQALMRRRRRPGRPGRGGAVKEAPDGHYVRMSDKEAEEFIAWHSYDPTNGSGSKGDIITVYGQH